MKPDFALILSFDGIGLLQRAGDGWVALGEVLFDSDDPDSALAALREGAAGDGDPALPCKLVLPDEQLKYLALDLSDDPGGAVRAALDGATPYPVDDLVHDWLVAEDRIEVAAVARETLAEAEAFAITHGFAPLSFVGRPMQGQFGREPFFGLTAHALARGMSADEIIGDPVPIQVRAGQDAESAGAASDAASGDVSDTAAGTGPAIPPAPAPDAMPDPVPEPPRAPDGPRDDCTPPAAPSEAPAEDIPAAAGDAALPAFTSIRAARPDGAAPPAARLDGVSRDIGAARVTLAPVDGAEAGQPPATPGGPEPKQPDAPPPVPAPPPAPAADHPFAPYPDPARSPPGQPAAAAVPPPRDESERMTIFGARQTAQVGGKPRYLGLMLTAVLLIFLIGVAAWASLFLDDGLARFFREDPAPASASLPQPDPKDMQPAETAAARPPANRAAPAPEVELPVLEDPATEILRRVTPRDLSPDEAKARYAATGIWQLAPEPPAEARAPGFEDFYQTTLDPPPAFADAVALPAGRAARGDMALAPQVPPPGPDATFTLDARGLVVATAEGALTPEGVRVFAGLPEVAMPAALRQGRAPAKAAAPLTRPRAELALLRPRMRPDDVAEQIERIGLNGRTLSELGALRPRLRPQSAQEAAREATAGAQAVAGAPDTEAPAPDPFAGATSQAVRASLKPATRPDGFDDIVASAERVAAPAPAETVRNAAPDIPSTASVARAATERNALDFKRVNLIGVYGTSANRRALVRMSNGRYQKVKVGDRLDGGRVSAIGDGELRYQKSGRNIILQMPRG